VVGRPLFIEPHGGLLHIHAMLAAKIIAREKGYRELDGSWMKDKGYYPGIPDLVVETDPKRYARAIIEIEVHLTKAAEKKKKDQFDRSLKGYDLFIINLAGLKKPYTIEKIHEYVGKWMP